MATVLPTANETPDVENVQENIIQRNAKVQQLNVHSVIRIHMKHGVTSALLGSLRNIGLKNCGIAVLTSSLPNILTLFSFLLLGLDHPRLLKYLNIEHSKTRNTG